MRGMKLFLALLAVLLTAGIVRREPHTPVDLRGYWRIDTYATSLRPEYAGKSTEHLVAWTGSDTGTLVYVDEDALEFWGERWPFAVTDVSASRVSGRLTDPQSQVEFDAHFDIHSRYVLFVYRPNEPFVLVRESG